MRRALAAVLLGSAVLLSGCGGSGGSKGDQTAGAGSTVAGAPTVTSATTTAGSAHLRPYETRMQALGASVSAVLTQVGNTEVESAQTANAGVRDAVALRKAQRALRAAAVQLEGITPPHRIAAEHRLLTRGVREYADELDGVIARLKAGDAPMTVLRSILTLTGIKEMQKASEQIAKKGYSISG